MSRKKWIAMLLAGGQGTRLGDLTKALAKPAVSFGGKYRIIDFALSNCTHSGIDTVGVMTQYEPHLLNAYVSNGSTWDLDRKFGGVSVLPPYMGSSGGNWYKGTADAVYQNIQFVEQHDPENVLIISGDHIYKMDYSRLLNFHMAKKSDATIAVIEVPWQETSRFGIMNTDQENRIVDFEEKPLQPKSNLASMGVYIFNWKKLKEYLIYDEEDVTSSNDFGKDLIPKLLEDGNRLFAYRFSGYWKDVGTINSLWEAHMDLLDDNPALDLYDHEWKIYAANANQPPEFLSPLAKVKQSLINEGCIVYGEIEHSVLSQNVYVGHGTKIKDSVIMPHAKIGNNVTIERAIINSNVTIEDGMVIGSSTNISSDITMISKSQSTSTNIQ